MRQRTGPRRALSFLLALVLALSLLPASALAASTAATVSGTHYTDLKDAWSAAVKNGGTLMLQQDVKISSRLKLEKGKSLTVNLNGHTISRNRSSSTSDGEVIWVGENASLTLNGGSNRMISYTGWNSNGKQTSNLSITSGGLITGGWSTNGAGGIHMKKNAKVTLNNVAVAGNRAERSWGSDGYGGGVMMDGSGCQLVLKNGASINYNKAAYGGGVHIEKENCSISMDNSAIDSNYSENGGGGIYSYDLKSVINMTKNASISHNSASEGGAIYFDYTQFVLKSSDATAQISHNTARSGKGGVLYMEHNRSALFIGDTNSGSVQGITFDSNYAKDYGGAIYIQQENIAVSNCNIINNTSSNYGGGIYNNNDANSISNCTITSNFAGEAGGGVYSSSMNDISLGGKVVIKYNHRGDSKADDLYLNDAVTTSYLIGSPSGQSEIGIRTENPTTRKLGKNQDYYFENAFFYDLPDEYHIEYQENRKELWLVEGARTTGTPDSVQPTATTTGDTYNGYPLVKGYFSFPSVVESTDDIDSVFYYSDGYFFEEPNIYNAHLASMSMAMAMAGFYSNIGNDGNGNKKTGSDDDRTYTYKSQNIEKLLTDIGVSSDDIYISDSNTVKPGTSSIGVAIGQKEIGSYVLVPIAVRGAGYESEWFGNVSVGQSGEHGGFAIAADQVFQQVQNYIRDYNLTDRVNAGEVRFWIAGYSRAGATSNLTAKRLIEAYCDGSGPAMYNEVYAYCFEAPKGGLNSTMKLDDDKYYSIHNCINKADFVPLVAPEEMGFIRYGVDHYVPGDGRIFAVPQRDSTVWSYVKSVVPSNYTTWYDNSAYAVGTTDYQNQRAKMLKQLNAIDPTNIYFYDSFKLAQVNYFKSAIGFDLISEIDTYNDNQEITQEEFARIFVRALQSWGFYRSYDSDFRYGYATRFSNAEGVTGAAFQETLQSVTKILFSKSASELNGMMEAASGAMDRLSTGQLFDIWNDMIGDWTTLNQSKREGYLEMLWKVVMEGKSAGTENVVYYLTDEETAELRASWNVLLDVLLRFVEVDYNTNVNQWDESKTPIKGVSTPVTENITKSFQNYFDLDGSMRSYSYSQVVLGTLAKNATALMQAHYPEINFAWLRTYDSFYDQEKTSVKIKAQEAPTVTATPDGDTITLSTPTKGAAIFYKVGDGVWRPYNKALDLNGKKLTISYTAVYCGATSAVETETFEPETTYTITVNDEVYGSYKEGEVVTVEAKTPEDKSFVQWEGDTDQVTLLTSTDSNGLTQAFTNAAISFKMPPQDLKFTTQMKDKVKEITLTVDETTGKTTKIELDGEPTEGQVVFNYSVQENTSPISTYSTEENATITAQALLNPNKTENVFFSDQTTATVNGKPCDVTYNAYDGSVTLTASKTTKVNPADYCTVTVNCYDLNIEKSVKKVTYTVKAGEPLTLVAPAVEDERFSAWENQADTQRQITITPTDDMEIQANYIPVVKEINITMQEPVVGETLPTEITKVTVTVTNTFDIPTTSIWPMWINWLDTDFMDKENGKVVAGDWYVVALFPFLSSGDETQFKYKYTLADNVKLIVNGKELTRDFLLYNGEGSMPVVYCVFEAGGGLITLGDELVSVQQPGTIVRNHGSDLNLPSEVTVNVADGTSKQADVKWKDYSDAYDKNSTAAQSFVVTGEVQYSNNPNGVDTTVQQTVVVNAAAQAAQVAMPTANIASGTYAQAQEIRLDCDTEGAAIYYTLDGSEPTTASTKYDGGIVTVSGYGTTKLRMIAVKDGMRDSMEASYQYELKRTSSGSSSKPTQPTEPTEPTEPTSGFQDVSKDAYYADAVAWAVKQGITNGVSQTQFGPDQGCTRAQIVTFLWRSAGSPEPKAMSSFADVPADAYYAKAVAWAVEQGITKGTSETAFSPDATCTRAPGPERDLPAPGRRLAGGRAREQIQRRGPGQLLRRRRELGRRRGHHQRHQREHLQPRADLHPRPDRDVPLSDGTG